jgi:hypothetical protein
VVVEGEYSDSDRKFRANIIGFPPAESRAMARQFLTHLDLFAPKSQTKALTQGIIILHCWSHNLQGQIQSTRSFK